MAGFPLLHVFISRATQLTILETPSAGDAQEMKRAKLAVVNETATRLRITCMLAAMMNVVCAVAVTSHVRVVEPPTLTSGSVKSVRA